MEAAIHRPASDRYRVGLGPMPRGRASSLLGV